MKHTIYLILMLCLAQLSFGQNGKFTELKHQCKDDIERPFIVYTPNSLDTNNSSPLLVYLHGGISSPKLKKDPLTYMQKSPLLPLADEGGFYLLFSYGQQGATWFDSIGTDMVLKEVETAQQQFNINTNKIFLSGFSDGASGVFYMSMTHPFSFAGCIVMNGSMAVAQKLGQKTLFPANTNNMPMYIINTTQDLLYPLNQIVPTIEYLQTYNPNITFTTPKGNHEMSYLATEQADLMAFINKHTKNTLEEFSWETDTPNSSVACLQNIVIDTTLARKNWHQAYQLKVFNQKAEFGLKYDYKYQGKGLKVNGFKNDSCTAKKMGIQLNDIILTMEEDTITSPYAPFYFLFKKQAGDSTYVTVLRDQQEQIIKGKFNEGFFYKVFDSAHLPSAKIIAIIKDKALIISTSRIAAFTIDFDPLQSFGIEKVLLNNKTLNTKLQGQQIVKVEDD